ncbi:pentapeptide repeat-containing protein [Phormidium tenue FACHB-886]|nr:pentapeptide repeat-containing protein [Phormidium tenue FACHB-886]
MHNQQQLDIPIQEEKTFGGQDLQGQSFRGQDLSNVDFSGCDIRGAVFTNAILKNANFANARAGLQLHTAIIAAILLFLTAVLLGVLTALLASVIGLQFHAAYLEFTAKIIALTVHCGFLIIALRKGITASFTVFAIAVALAFTAAMIHSVAIPTAAAIAIASVLDFAVASLTMAAVGLSLIAWTVVNRKVAIVVAIGFALAFLGTLSVAPTSVSGAAIIMTVLILSAYVSWRALRRRETISTISGTLFARWGTSFRGADLTGANFSQAILKNTDFRGAVLGNARWQDREIDFLLN